MHLIFIVQHFLRIFFHLKVNPGSKAGTACLREGDVISSINGIPSFTLTRDEAKQQINLDSETLELRLNQPHHGDNGGGGSPGGGNGKRGIRGSLRRLARTLSKGKVSEPHAHAHYAEIVRSTMLSNVWVF